MADQHPKAFRQVLDAKRSVIVVEGPPQLFLALTVWDVFKQIGDRRLEEFAQLVYGIEVNAGCRLVVEQRDRIAMQPGSTSYVRNFQLALAHEAR